MILIKKCMESGRICTMCSNTPTNYCTLKRSFLGTLGTVQVGHTTRNSSKTKKDLVPCITTMVLQKGCGQQYNNIYYACSECGVRVATVLL